jgi:hypothetical protein
VCAEAGGPEGLLLGNWGELVALGSDERVVGVYKGVRAGRLRRVPRDYEYIGAELGETAEGDLLLTDRRLLHLEYDYGVVRRSSSGCLLFFGRSTPLSLVSRFYRCC